MDGIYHQSYIKFLYKNQVDPVQGYSGWVDHGLQDAGLFRSTVFSPIEPPPAIFPSDRGHFQLQNGHFCVTTTLLPMGGKSNRKIRPLQISCNRLLFSITTAPYYCLTPGGSIRENTVFHKTCLLILGTSCKKLTRFYQILIPECILFNHRHITKWQMINPKFILQPIN